MGEQSCPVVVERAGGEGLVARLQLSEHRRFLRVPIRLSLRYETVGAKLVEWVGTLTMEPEKQRTLEVQLQRLASKGEK